MRGGRLDPRKDVAGPLREEGGPMVSEVVPSSAPGVVYGASRCIQDADDVGLEGPAIRGADDPASSESSSNFFGLVGAFALVTFFFAGLDGPCAGGCTGAAAGLVRFAVVAALRGAVLTGFAAFCVACAGFFAALAFARGCA